MPDLPSGTVTFLFTDIEGSTALWERDRQAMAQAVERHLALLDAASEAMAGCCSRPWVTRSRPPSYRPGCGRRPNSAPAICAAQLAVPSVPATGAVARETPLRGPPARRSPARISTAPIACRSIETNDVLAFGAPPFCLSSLFYLGVGLIPALPLRVLPAGGGQDPFRLQQGRNVAVLNAGLASGGIRVHARSPPVRVLALLGLACAHGSRSTTPSAHLSPPFHPPLTGTWCPHVPCSPARMRARPHPPAGSRSWSDGACYGAPKPFPRRRTAAPPPHRGGPLAGGVSRAGGVERAGHRRSGARHPPGAAARNRAAAGECPRAGYGRPGCVARRRAPRDRDPARSPASTIASLASLPVPPTRLIGRETEVAAIVRSS